MLYATTQWQPSGHFRLKLQRVSEWLDDRQASVILEVKFST